ncbi:MAG: pentapeptide repeat-containing protein [Anaerohalosphaeraceae bacterium]
MMRCAWAVCFCAGLLFSSFVRGDIYNWQTGQVISGTEGITPGPGVNLQFWSYEPHTLQYADFSGGLDLSHSTFSLSWLDYARFTGANLTGASFDASKLTNADMSGANLTAAYFNSASLSDADLSGATVTGADFSDTTSKGFTQSQLYSTVSYQNGDLHSIKLEFNDLVGWNFTNQNLTGASFSRSTMTYANLSGANLTGADFGYSTLTDADLSGANLAGASLDHSMAANANLSGANLTHTKFNRSELTNADLSGADLTGANLNDYSTLTGADLSGANLTGASFDSSTLTDADLSGAIVTGANFHAVWGFTKEQLYSTASYQSGDLHGIELGSNNLIGWNFANQNLAGANLSAVLKDADLSGANLTNAKFNQSTLTGADLRGANLTSADFSLATLTSTTNLSGATLTNVKFKESKLTNANLSGVNLAGADFYLATLTDADLGGANLTDASFERSVMANADLSGTIIAGANFSYTTGFTQSQLYSTASYQAGDLHGIELRSKNLVGWNFVNQNLTGANFYGSALNNANLSGSNLNGAAFHYATLTNTNLSGAFVAGAAIGLTQSKLYSTASYQTGDLHGIKFLNGDMNGWNFANQNLTDADFGQFMLFTSDLSGADMRGVKGAWWWMGVIARNTIRENGHIQGLNLTAGDVLKIRDYDGGIGITIESGMNMADSAILDIILSDATWGSTILVDAGIVPDLGGILRLEFAAGINPADLVGTTFDLFDWNGTLLSGDCFGQVVSLPGVGWDLSSLYTTGEVTLTAVPEPAALLLLGLGGLALRNRRQSCRADISQARRCDQR